ncbi:MAG: damage-inducible protein DinB [Spirochaetaceae bacterium]|nr:damage-inducible protein DinB [Spirochaetaceae bacterium]
MTAIKTHIIFAKHNADANVRLVEILNKMSPDEREKERGSYYGSLSGLARHILGGSLFFAGLFKDALAHNAAASKILNGLVSIPYPPKGELSESQWKDVAASIAKADEAVVALAQSLAEAELDAAVCLDWYGGSPPSVPLAFMLQQLTAHNIHHRGQASQILDELKIENDYSGINISIL